MLYVAVFSMLLGDTLWIESLDHANSYRIEVRTHLINYVNCVCRLKGRWGREGRMNRKDRDLINKI